MGWQDLSRNSEFLLATAVTLLRVHGDRQVESQRWARKGKPPESNSAYVELLMAVIEKDPKELGYEFDALHTD